MENARACLWHLLIHKEMSCKDFCQGIYRRFTKHQANTASHGFYHVPPEFTALVSDLEASHDWSKMSIWGIFENEHPINTVNQSNTIRILSMKFLVNPLSDLRTTYRADANPAPTAANNIHRSRYVSSPNLFSSSSKNRWDSGSGEVIICGRTWYNTWKRNILWRQFFSVTISIST